MKKAFFLAVIALLSPVPLKADAIFDLQHCYELAKQRSELIAISDQEINQARARFQQVLGVVVPKLTVTGTESLQDDSASGSAGGNSVSSTLTRFSRPEVKVTAEQTLFKGLKEYKAMSLARIDRNLQEFKKKEAERLLFQDVATAFFTITKLEMTIRTSERIRDVLKGRTHLLHERVTIGKSRESELLAEEATLSLLEADLEKQRGLKNVAYEMMSFLTGQEPQPPVALQEDRLFDLKPEEFYVSLGKTRSDVQAAKKTEEFAKGEIQINRGDLLPEAKVAANYYPYRAGFLGDIKWDTMFTVTVPIFNWTSYGQIREAKSKAAVAALQTQETERSAVRDVKRAYQTYQSSLRQYQQYQVASQKGAASFQRQNEDFKSGLTTNLEVLQSERTWLDAMRSKDEATVQLWADELALQTTAGILP